VQELIEIGDLQIAIYNVKAQFYAADNVCTHAFALLTDGILDGVVTECPLHGGCFNVKWLRVEAGTIEVKLREAIAPDAWRRLLTQL
jgi:hypothetical protein